MNQKFKRNIRNVFPVTFDQINVSRLQVLSQVKYFSISRHAMMFMLSVKVFTVFLNASSIFPQITSEIGDIFEHILFQCLDIDKQTQQPLPSTRNTFGIEIHHTWTQSLVSHDCNSSSSEILSAVFSIS